MVYRLWPHIIDSQPSCSREMTFVSPQNTFIIFLAAAGVSAAIKHETQGFLPKMAAAKKGLNFLQELRLSKCCRQHDTICCAVWRM